MSNPLTLLLTATVLVAGVVLAPLVSYTAVYFAMGGALIGAGVLVSRLGVIARHPAYLAVLCAFVLFFVTLPFAWHSADDLLIIFALLPIVGGIGIVALIEAEPRFGSPAVIGGLALIGSVGAMFAALNDVYVLGVDRAGSGNNPIHFADLSLVLGFMSVIGLFGTQKRWRLIFLSGPFFAFVAILLSGTRGAVLAFFVVAVPLTILLIVWFRHVRKIAATALVTGVIALIGLMLWSPGVSERALSGFTDTTTAVSALLSGDSVAKMEQYVDESTMERIIFLRSGFEVFRAHPLFGVGAGQIISATRDHYPEDHAGLGTHLHSDLSDFSVAAGLLGLVGYILLLVSPFLRSMGNYGADTRHALIFGALALSGSYLALGLTNAIFGILPQTMLFGVFLACLVAMGRVALLTPTEQVPH